MRSDGSRRSFLMSTGDVLMGAWLASNWSGIAAAADHAAHVAASPAPTGFEFLSAPEAADVAAIAAQIVPSGATPGAREAHAVYFIDRALATFFANRAAAFRTEFAEFAMAFRTAQPAAPSFASLGNAQQIAFLKTVDRTPFFESMRMLTLLGMFSSPRYAGNYEESGWKMLGFEDQHVFVPPFGYYDREYTGFVPYEAKPDAAKVKT